MPQNRHSGGMRNGEERGSCMNSNMPDVSSLPDITEFLDPNSDPRSLLSSNVPPFLPGNAKPFIPNVNAPPFVPT
jgi:hypothetical protein